MTTPAKSAIPPGAAFAATGAQLARRQLELEAEINRKMDELRGGRVGFDASTSTDGGDGAQIDAQGSVQQAEIERDLDEVRDISTALERIASGDYGTCVACGEAIEPGRLQAWPTARRCTACQSVREKSRPRPPSL